MPEVEKTDKPKCACGNDAVVENVFTHEWVCGECAQESALDPEPEDTPSIERPMTYYSER